MKLRIQLVIWNIRKEKNSQSEQEKEKEFLKNEDSIRSLLDNFKCTNICMMGVLEGKEKQQEIEDLFEKIMTENFLNL